MKLGYILRLGAVSVAAGFAFTIGCSGASSSDLLSPGGDTPGGGGDASATLDGSRNDSGAPPVPDAGSDTGQPEVDSGANPGIRCDDGTTQPEKSCTVSTQFCCISTTFGIKSYDCSTSDVACGQSRVQVECDSDGDCPRGNRCCGHLSNNSHLDGVACKSGACSADNNEVNLCHPGDTCTGGRACTGEDTTYPAYRYCE